MGLRTSHFGGPRTVGNDPDQDDASEADEAYVMPFSSRAIPALGAALGADSQELDLLAPGIYTVAPGDHGSQAGLFFWGGTSMSAPLVAGVLPRSCWKRTPP